MIKTIMISILAGFVFWGSVNTDADEQTLTTPAIAASQEEPLQVNLPGESTKEWYIVAKIPSTESLKIGVFLFHEGMSKEHICDKFGEPVETIILDVEGYHGSILLYPHHYFFLSRTGHLKTIRERP
jgi:hypothetical protein